MRCTVIGPTHPYKGGVAQHTTTLAHRLTEAGHEVDLVSWSAQYPALLYPGVQRVQEPEVPVHPRTRHPLAWYRPDTWWRVGRQLGRGSPDLLVLVLVTPVQIPAYLVVLAAMGSRRRRPQVAVVCHNVLPHENRPGDRTLVAALLRRADRVVTHSAEQAQLAGELGARHVVPLELPPHGPAANRVVERGPGGRGLLFFGFIRPYKGVDVLLRAVARVPGVRLVVAGEAWDGAGSLEAQVVELGLADRVELRLRYLPEGELEQLLAGADALVIPYVSGTGTQVVRVAQRHGLPVVATRISTVPDQVADGEDGLLVPPGDVDALAAAIRRLYEPGVLPRLRSAVRPPDDDLIWRPYVAELTGTRS